MVESADARERDNTSVHGRLHRASRRRIAGERQVGPVVVVVARIRTHASEQVKLAEHDEVIDNFATEGSWSCPFEIGHAQAV